MRNNKREAKAEAKPADAPKRAKAEAKAQPLKKPEPTKVPESVAPTKVLPVEVPKPVEVPALGRSGVGALEPLEVPQDLEPMEVPEGGRAGVHMKGIRDYVVAHLPAFLKKHKIDTDDSPWHQKAPSQIEMRPSQIEQDSGGRSRFL